MHKWLMVWSVLVVLIVAPIAPVLAQGKSISVIRDEETEVALREYSHEIFKAAGLAPQNITIIIVNDEALNAFVTAGMRMFVNTGLIVESESPEMLIGVMAHEAGHIAGGHVIRQQQEFENVGIGAAISYVLGAASIAAGVPAVGQAIITGGTHAAQRTALSYSRVHEESADHAALNYLDKVGYSSTGLLALLEKLGNREAMFHSDADPYALTHPLSPERISRIKDHLSKKEGEYHLPERFKVQQKRIVAKLVGFMQPMEQVLLKYPETDMSLPGRYARAIAHYRASDIETAITQIDGLIADFPEDTYFHELKGQVLFEHGRIAEAVPEYKKAVALLPGAGLLHMELGVAQLALDDPEARLEAIEHLERAVVKESSNAFAWHQLGVAYGRAGKLGHSYLAFAEEAALKNNKEDVKLYVGKAKEYLPKNSPAALKVKDLIRATEEKKNKKSEKSNPKEQTNEYQ